MCGTVDPNCPQWYIIHFLMIGLTIFTNLQTSLTGGQEPMIEILLLVMTVAPVLFVQLKLGGMAQQGVMGLFHKFFPFFRGVAVMLLIQMFILGTYWPVLPVQNICAAFASVSGERSRMTSCANSWNTPRCREPLVDPAVHTNDNVSDPGYGFSYTGTSPLDEYIGRSFYQWHRTTPSDLGGFASGFPKFPIALVVTWIFIFVTVAFGARVFAWVVSVLGVVATLMLVGVLGYGWSVAAQVSRSPARALLYLYLPSYNRMISVHEWMACANRVIRFIPLWLGVLPTVGKMVGSNKIIRNITWLFVIIQVAVLRHLPALTFAPYQYAAAEAQQQSMGAVMSRHISVPTALAAFVYSPSHPSAAFFYFLARYIHHVCNNAFLLLVIVDNCLEVFDWLMNKHGCNKRKVWFVVTAILSVIMMLLGLPYTTRGGMNLLVIVDMASVKLSFVTRYFVGLGIVVIYVRQNVATAERVVIGLWVFFATVAWIILGIGECISSGCEGDIFLANGESLNRKEKEKWNGISWGIAGAPFVFIIVGCIVYLIQFLVQRTRSGNMAVDQPHPPEEAVLLKEKREDGDYHVTEDVQRISTC